MSRGRLGVGTVAGLVVLALALALPGAAVAAVSRAGVPVEPDRRTAASWAARELDGREYQAARPGPLTRLANWMWEQLQQLPAFTGTGSRFTVLVIVLAAVLLVVLAVHRSGGLHRQARTHEDLVFDAQVRSAAGHRAAAEAAEREADWRTAVLERFRALTRELEERAVLVAQPGRTADEVAAEAAARLPGLAERLQSAAGLFDGVRYGDEPASAASATLVRELDDALRRARPAVQPVPIGTGPVAPS